MPVITELLARLGVESKTFNADLKRAEGTLKGTAKSVEASSAKATQSLTGFGGAVGRLRKRVDEAKQPFVTLNKLLGALFVIKATQAVLRSADAYTALQNRLRAVTNSSEELARVQDRLFHVSRDTRSSVEANTELFSRLALSTRELGVSESQLIDFTRSLNQAIKLSGATATEAQAGILQLSQGMASGALRGDELRSVLEQLPAVADVIAKQLGVTRGKLREMGTEGKITAEVILDAFKSAREELSERFAKTVPTMSEAIVVLKDSFLRLVGTVSELVGLGSTLSEVLTNIASLFDGITESLEALHRVWTSVAFQRTPFSKEQLEELNRLAGGQTPIVGAFNRQQGLEPQGAEPVAPITPGQFFSDGGFMTDLAEGYAALRSKSTETFAAMEQSAISFLLNAGTPLNEFFAQQIPSGISTAQDTVSTFFQDISEKQTAFSQQANEAWSSWLAQATSVTANVKLAVLDFFQSFSAGFGDALAQVIVFQADFAETMKSFLKNLLAQVISTLTQIVVQWVIATIAQAVIGTAGHIQRVGQALQLVYLNAFAATAAIPIIGPVLAPGVAAASTAAAAGGSIAAAATGGGVGSAGSLALGLDTGGLIASEGLAFLHAGEVVATPDEVKDAMTGDRGGFTFNLHLDGRLVARSILPHIPREIRMRGV